MMNETGIGAKMDARQSQMSEQIEQLNKTIMALGELFDKFQERLEPITYQKPEPLGDEKQAVEQDLAELPHVIRTMRQSLEHTIESFNSLYDDLEI